MGNAQPFTVAQRVAGLETRNLELKTLYNPLRPPSFGRGGSGAPDALRRVGV